MGELTTDEQLAAIERLLDEGDGREGVEDLSLVQRVQDVTVTSNSWSDLAIKRLHQIHQLSSDECEFCSRWLDGTAQLPLGVRGALSYPQGRQGC